MNKVVCAFMMAVLGTAVAKADEVNITLDQATQTASAGGTTEFFGTITNNTNTTIYLNSDDLNFSSPGFTVTDQFFTTVPLSLAPSGQAGDSSGDIELFDISVNSPFTGTAGLNSGTYTLFGGDDGGADTAQDNLGSASFAVNVQAATPEPSSVWLLLTGLSGAGVPVWRRCKRRIL